MVSEERSRVASEAGMESSGAMMGDNRMKLSTPNLHRRNRGGEVKLATHIHALWYNSQQQTCHLLIGCASSCIQNARFADSI